jgi:hypothetical protein
MSGLKPLLAIALLGATTLLAEPAGAATARRHVTCVTIYFVLTTPLGGTTNSSSVNIKNNLSTTIPAGTVFTYTIPGHQRTYTAAGALAPDQMVNIPDAGVTASGTCDASFPDTHFGVQTNITKLTKNGLKLQRSP